MGWDGDRGIRITPPRRVSRTSDRTTRVIKGLGCPHGFHSLSGIELEKGSVPQKIIMASSAGKLLRLFGCVAAKSPSSSSPFTSIFPAAVAGNGKFGFVAFRAVHTGNNFPYISPNNNLFLGAAVAVVTLKSFLVKRLPRTNSLHPLSITTSNRVKKLRSRNELVIFIPLPPFLPRL